MRWYPAGWIHAQRFWTQVIGVPGLPFLGQGGYWFQNEALIDVCVSHTRWPVRIRFAVVPEYIAGDYIALRPSIGAPIRGPISQTVVLVTSTTSTWVG